MIDLHIHTTCSDGVLTPKEVIDKAYKNNVKYMAIADHDTIMAYKKDTMRYAESLGITLIPAVEMSAKTGIVGVHVLGYNFDINNKKLLSTLEDLKNARQDYLVRVVDRLKELGYTANLEELKKVPSVTKSNIAKNIISLEENHAKFIQEFGHVPTKGEFIETIMNEGCPGHVNKYNITPNEASRVIKEAGGIVVLAHPVCYKYEDNLDTSGVLDILHMVNPDGVETKYLYVDRKNNLVDEIDYWSDIAKAEGKFMTIGSDFHNEDGIHPQIGFENYPYVTMIDSDIEALLKNLKIK